MADHKEKIATCPVCGAQERAEDVQALTEAMQQHMHLTHSMDVPLSKIAAEIKGIGPENAHDMPAVPAVPAVQTGTAGSAFPSVPVVPSKDISSGTSQDEA